MGEATKSQHGRTKRPPISSRRRGTNFYDRLEEARLRRQAVLANQEVARAAPPANDQAGFRNEFSIVEAGTESTETEEPGRSSPEPALNLPVVVPQSQADGPLWPSWYLFFPGIAVGFVLAIAIIEWTASTRGSTVPVGVVEAIEPGHQAPQTFAATRVQSLTNGDSPLVSYDARPQARIAPTSDRIDPPIATDWPPPAQIVPATVELPPLIDVTPPARHVGPPLVLNKIPPIRAKTAEAQAIVTPVFPGLDIVLHTPNGVRRSDAQTLIAAAADAGFAIAKTRPAAFSISQTNVRYFHERDAVAAQALASAVGGRLRDFTDYRPPPDPGVIEVWLQGRGNSPRGQRDAEAGGGILRDLRNLRTELRRVFAPGGG